MKIKLYKPFEHWYHGGTIYLYSDPHFDDPESKEMNPNWPDADEIVKSINNGLGKNDTIIFLGDIGSIDYIKKIKGYKVLILGNHDAGASNYQGKWNIEYYVNNIQYMMPYDSKGQAEKAFEDIVQNEDEHNSAKLVWDGLFNEVYEGPLFINEKILLSHEPIDLKFGYNIHGHCHSGKMLKYNEDFIQINIASDVVNFNKQRLDNLCSLGKPKDVHRLAIDHAIERKGK